MCKDHPDRYSSLKLMSFNKFSIEVLTGGHKSIGKLMYASILKILNFKKEAGIHAIKFLKQVTGCYS